MSSLVSFNLAINRITKIGLNVFTAQAELVSLHDITLDSNELTELEPWLFIRGQLVLSSSVCGIIASPISQTNFVEVSAAGQDPMSAWR